MMSTRCSHEGCQFGRAQSNVVLVKLTLGKPPEISVVAVFHYAAARCQQTASRRNCVSKAQHVMFIATRAMEQQKGMLARALRVGSLAMDVSEGRFESHVPHLGMIDLSFKPVRIRVP
jgi:hypothetical protein